MTWLKKIGSIAYKGWMVFAHALGSVYTMVLLILAYLIIIGPIAIVLWFARRDFLERKLHRGSSYWREHELTQNTLETAQRQF
jgi:hypothetical protein